MTCNADLVAEIERRAAEAQDTLGGPDYHAIVHDVAEQAGISFEELRSLWLDNWLMGAS